MAHHYGLFCAQYRPHVGGVEIYTQNLARELVAAGNDVAVITSKLDASASHEVQDDGVEVFRLPCHALMDGRLPISKRSREYRQELRGIAELGIDRVLVNTRFYRHSLEGLRFARNTGVPAVVLDHGSAYLVLGNPAADAALRIYEHGMTWAGRRFDPTYAGVSTASVRWLNTFGIQAKTVIPNAIDAKAFRNDASSRNFRDELDIRPAQTLVVFVGRLAPEKGIMQLVEAARLLGPDFAFVCAGDGALRDKIFSQGLRNVHLLGVLNRGDLSALHSQGDIFCLPSRSEGFCTSLLEAGAWGLTPVMTHVGGVDEVMGDPVRFGRVLPNGNPLTIAGALSELVQSGVHGLDDAFARKVEQEHSWAESARALESCFGSC